MKYLYVFLCVFNLFTMAWQLTDTGGPHSYTLAALSAFVAATMLCLALAE